MEIRRRQGASWQVSNATEALASSVERGGRLAPGGAADGARWAVPCSPRPPCQGSGIQHFLSGPDFKVKPGPPPPEPEARVLPRKPSPCQVCALMRAQTRGRGLATSEALEEPTWLSLSRPGHPALFLHFRHLCIRHSVTSASEPTQRKAWDAAELRGAHGAVGAGHITGTNAERLRGAGGRRWGRAEPGAGRRKGGEGHTFVQRQEYVQG